MPLVWRVFASGGVPSSGVVAVTRASGRRRSTDLELIEVRRRWVNPLHHGPSESAPT